MSLDQLKAFLARMQDDLGLRQAVQAVLLRLPGQKVGRVTVTKQNIRGEYN